MSTAVVLASPSALLPLSLTYLLANVNNPAAPY